MCRKDIRPCAMAARAAQFGSFAALKGHGDAIKGVAKFYCGIGRRR